MNNDVSVIPITGGPHAGKSTLLERLPEVFGSLGYAVEVLPEVATQLMREGTYPTDDLYQFQRLVLSGSIAQEEAAKEKLRGSGKPGVIFPDRGVMDGLAYIDRTSMEAIWQEQGHHLVGLRDERYAGVVYLESTGIGMPDLFGTANNETRYERCAKDAADTCERTLAAWVGCPHLGYADSGTDFEGKMDRAIAWARYFLDSVEHERKFRLLVPFDPSMLPAHAQRIEIRQCWVRMPGESKVTRIRMRGQDDRFAHYQTVKGQLDGITCPELDTPLNERDYAHLHGTARLPDHAEVVKDRWCFVANGHYCEMDVFRDWPHDVLLEIEVPDPTWPVRLPSFLEGKVEEVTGNWDFSNREIAKKIAALRSAA